MYFVVWDPAYLIVCNEEGTNGSCAFTAMYHGGSYNFTARNIGEEGAQPVNFTGSYNSPGGGFGP